MKSRGRLYAVEKPEDVVYEQGTDNRLWGEATTDLEELLQSALQRLHAAVSKEDWSDDE